MNECEVPPTTGQIIGDTVTTVALLAVIALVVWCGFKFIRGL